MPRRPSIIALDVNETLSDMRPLAARFEESGASPHLLGTWFASTLRDGFALTAAGSYADFMTVARAALLTLLSASEADDPAAATDHVLAGFGELPLHPDVIPGLDRVGKAGFRIVTLTNGSAEFSRQLLERGGVTSVERHLSVEAVRRWKPAAATYLHAAHRCGVAPGEMMLVAVHPWDTDGAKRAGLAACWINRQGAPYPESFRAPELICSSLVELVQSLSP